MENTQADQLAKRWMERFEKTNAPDQKDLEDMEYLLYEMRITDAVELDLAQ